MRRVPPMLALVADSTTELRAHYEESLAAGEHEAERTLDRMVAHLREGRT